MGPYRTGLNRCTPTQGLVASITPQWHPNPVPGTPKGRVWVRETGKAVCEWLGPHFPPRHPQAGSLV